MCDCKCKSDLEVLTEQIYDVLNELNKSAQKGDKSLVAFYNSEQRRIESILSNVEKKMGL